jgi:hypothetical protein
VADKKRSVSIIIQARNDASKALNSVLSSLSSFAGIAIGVTAAAGAMSIAFKKVVDAASEQEKSDVALAQALTTVGQNTEATRADLGAFIDEMEDLTKVNDETISSVLSLLTQFGRLRGEGLKQATRAVLDYSAATGTDAVTAATQLSNVIVKGTGRLAGINTKFAEGATSAERYNQVIRQLQNLHGAAEAKGKTFEGALAQIGIEFERLEETIGKNIIESEAFRTVIEVFSGLIKAATGIVKEHGGTFRELITLWAQGAIFITRLGVQFATWEVQLIESNIRAAEFVVTLGTLVTALGAVAAKKLGFDAEGIARAAAGMAKILPDLERARALVGGLGDAGEEALKALDDALKNLKTGTVGVGKVVPQVGTDLQTVTTAAEALDEVMKQLGGPTLEQLERQAGAVDRALSLVAEAQETSANPEQYDAIIESLIQITEQTQGWITDLTAAAGATSNVSSVMRDVELAAGEAATQGALQLGDALIDAAMGAKVAFSQFLKRLLADMAKAIAKALILRAILGIATSGGSEIAGGAAGAGGASIGGGLVSAAEGGLVTGGILGRDSVAAMLMPGEVVLPRNLAQNFDALAEQAGDARRPRSMGRSSDVSSVIAQFNLHVLDKQRVVRDLIDAFNEAVERKGYRLVSSEVRT